MKWVIMFLFSMLILLAVAVMLSACTGSVRHSSRTLTCLGFCNETEVTHKTDKPVEVEAVETKKEPP